MHSLIIFALLVALAKSNRVSILLIATLYFCTMLALMSMTNTLRQGIAVILFAIYATSVFGRRTNASIVSGLALALSHGSGMLMLAIPILTKYVLNRRVLNAKRFVFLYLPIFLTAIAGALIAGNIIFDQFNFTGKLQFYFENQYSFSDKHPLERPWVLLTIASAFGILLITIFNTSYDQKANFGIDTEWIKLYTFAIFIWMLSIPAPGFFERFGDYIAILQILLIALFISNTKRQRICATLAICCLCTFFGYLNYFSDTAKLVIGL
jgi:hypothetical protein